MHVSGDIFFYRDRMHCLLLNSQWFVLIPKYIQYFYFYIFQMQLIFFWKNIYIIFHNRCLIIWSCVDGRILFFKTNTKLFIDKSGNYGFGGQIIFFKTNMKLYIDKRGNFGFRYTWSNFELIGLGKKLSDFNLNFWSVWIWITFQSDLIQVKFN